MASMSVIVGAVAALAARALFVRVILVKLRRDVRRFNGGDYQPLLTSYADDAVLRFNQGAHRWSGEHRGKAAIESFLRDLTGVGLQGEIKTLWIAGPPWALTLGIRFDDRATGPHGEEIYANRTVIVLRTRWGRIVEHEDFYEDTGRLVELGQRLQELGASRSTPLPGWSSAIP